MIPIQDDELRKRYLDELSQQFVRQHLNKIANEEAYPVESKRNTKALKYLEKITGIKASAWYDFGKKQAAQEVKERLSGLTYHVVFVEAKKIYRVFGTNEKGIRYPLGWFKRMEQAMDHVERLKAGKF